MCRYDGDTTTCKRCGNVHHLGESLIVYCERCGFDMRVTLTPGAEKALIDVLDYSYRSARIDDLL